MLTITPQALAVVQRVTDHPRLEPASGLRIARREDASAPLEVRAVSHPQPGDSVVERLGGRLYLGSGTKPRIEDRELDVVDQHGRVQFILRAVE